MPHPKKLNGERHDKVGRDVAAGLLDLEDLGLGRKLKLERLAGERDGRGRLVQADHDDALDPLEARLPRGARLQARPLELKARRRRRKRKLAQGARRIRGVVVVQKQRAAGRLLYAHEHGL